MADLRARPPLFGLLALVLLMQAGPLEAQEELTFRAGLGATLPLGAAADGRAAGPAAMFAAETRLNRSWDIRLDAEWSRLQGNPAAGVEPDLRVLGASLNLVLRGRERTPLYLLFGAGAYRLQNIGFPSSPYGTTAALQGGIGIDVNRWERVKPFVETRAMIHLTDHAAGDFAPSILMPVLIGVRITRRGAGEKRSFPRLSPRSETP